VSTILSLTRNVDVYVAKISEGNNSHTLESVESVAEVRIVNRDSLALLAADTGALCASTRQSELPTKSGM
jgi:hypothetical protein